LVDDGSTDDTTAIAKQVLAEYESLPKSLISYEQNRGKGFAVRKGFAAARGEIALFSDADLSTPIEELPKLIDPIECEEFDITFGSRALDRSLIGEHQPWRREQGGKVFNLIARLATGLPFWDTQCGFKAFNMKKFRPLLPLMTIDRFGFDVEFLYVANLHGLRLKEIPVRWNHREASKVSVFRDSQRMIRELFQIRRNKSRGRYEHSEISGERFKQSAEN
jgi:glycosyltransferase involved in cell wall biosynthesis